MAMTNKTCFFILFFLMICHSGYAQNNASEESDRYLNTEFSKEEADSIKLVRFAEIGFVIEQIENSYISGRRGLSDEEWEYRVGLVYDMLNDLFLYRNDYFFTWRYLGLLIHDFHFSDSVLLNKERAFTETDMIFPLWVRTWEDGSVYNVKDYTGVIPHNARILSVNGYSADSMALINRMMVCAEDAIATAVVEGCERRPVHWPNFSNILFCNRINPPYEVAYVEYGKQHADTAVLDGIGRKEKWKMYKRSGDKRLVRQYFKEHRKPIVYNNIGDNIGVLSINSFWGGNIADLLIFGGDARFKRLLRQAMRQIDRDGIEDLVIDVSHNGGGMTDNVYLALSYLTDEPISAYNKYYVTDNSRKIVMTNISSSSEYSEEDKERFIELAKNVEEGTVIELETQIIANTPKHPYKGNVYVLTSNSTYSGGQLFSRYCQTLDIGVVAGQHCGGYNEITGNSVQITLPYKKFMDFRVPYVASMACKEDDPYAYPPVEIPIEYTFEEWFNHKSNSLDTLINIIRTNKKEDIVDMSIIN